MKIRRILKLLVFDQVVNLENIRIIPKRFKKIANTLSASLFCVGAYLESCKKQSNNTKDRGEYFCAFVKVHAY